MRNLFFLAAFCLVLPLTAQDARQLIDETIAAVGGLQAMHALKDVSYSYTSYRGTSEERYIFDGEISWGKSTSADGKTRVQFFDGKEAFVWVDGMPTQDEKELKSAMFSRKTNYYWLAMIQKLGDPGLLYEYLGTRDYEGIPYELVDVTFEDGVGVAKDRYLLYINPYTKLVDQFLFTVAAAGRSTPIMMKYTYDTFPGGVKFPVIGQSHAALNWEGELDPKAKWSARWRSDFSFNNGYTKETIKK